MGGQPKLAIGEDDDENKKPMPVSLPHCRLNSMPEDVFQMVVGYVQKYFTCYDSDRQGLLGAYNPKVTFSLCLNMSNAVGNRCFRFEDCAIKDNRNLKRIRGNDGYHYDKRAKLLHIGYIDTVNFLCKLPPSEHEPSSFKLDNCFFSNNLITFSLSGVFKEGKATDKVRPLRSFHRIFACIPDVNCQMTIVNEQFIMCNVSDYQYRTYFAQKQSAQTMTSQSETASSSSLNSNVDVISSKPVAPELVGLNEQQVLMVQEFSVKSRLNFEWSKHCLEHSKWNFDEAAQAFMQFKESIPKEAYLV